MTTNHPLNGTSSQIDPEELRPFLTDYIESITNRKGSNYICPLCGSGSGPNGTAAFSVQGDGEKWKCFSCGKGGDLFDLIGLKEELPSFKDQAARAAELFVSRATAPQPTPKPTEPERPRQVVDFAPFIEVARQAISWTDYPQKRGLSPETIERFRLGYYDPSNTEARETFFSLYGSDPIKAPALIIPYPGTGYYIARKVDPRDSGDKHRKPSSEKAGPEPLFNLEALYNPEGRPVFITEGPLDAMSIEQAGGKAIAVSGTARTRLLKTLKERPTKNAIIIATDNDGPGQRAAAELEAKLKGIGVDCTRADLTGDTDAKDANEALQRDPEKLANAIQDAIHQTDPGHFQNSAAARLRGFLRGIDESVNTPCIPTGFPALDKLLDGGLYEGLYAIGAVSSLGKTTLTLQAADAIAKSGTDVLFFSLEMSANEIIAKSISRLTFERRNGFPKNAKTTRGILDGKRWTGYNEAEQKLINDALNTYREETAPRLYIIEGMGDVGVKEIWKAVEKHICLTGRRPVVFIDYLQVLAPYNDRATDKQNTDKNVLELKRISRDLKVPVLAISSFNRASYNGPVTLEAFKESGAIEYSADVVLGIHAAGIREKAAEAAKHIHNHKAETRREVEVFILKNRNGQTHKGVGMVYETLFNHFQETGPAAPSQSGQEGVAGDERTF